jgi:hypothetical protein
LADGSSRTLDAAFFLEKVRHPTELTVKDYPAVMPEIQLTDDEINEMEAYLEGLQK